ncbi:MAG: hypothetical protein ABIL62_00390 [Planctomycetota bacterium]
MSNSDLLTSSRRSEACVSAKLRTWRCKEAGLTVSKLVSQLETGSRSLDKNDPPLAGFVRNPALLGRVSKTSIDTSIDNLNRKVEVLKWQ